MSDIHPGISTANPDAYRADDRKDYAAGEGLMTASQVAELLCLAQSAGEPEAYDESLTRFEAANRIKLLRRKLDG